MALTSASWGADKGVGFRKFILGRAGSEVEAVGEFDGEVGVVPALAVAIIAVGIFDVLRLSRGGEECAVSPIHLTPQWTEE